MAKAAFFNLPFYGHMHPTLPLVAEMVKRGEQVIYYGLLGLLDVTDDFGDHPS